MADGRKRSAAKQARRDARRRKARQGRAVDQETPEETPLIDEVREALDGGQPMDLLGLVSMLMLATSPRPALLRQRDQEDPPRLDELVAAFIGVRVPETTALLTVLGQLVVDDAAMSEQCRREVDARTDVLPPWLASLAQTSVHRVVRMAHVLGDGEELLLGVRLADGQEMSCAVFVDHLMMSEIKDAFFVPESIDTTLEVARRNNDDPDISFVEVPLTDARARLQKALDMHLKSVQLEESDTWPGCRALVRWLIQLMPEDGSEPVAPQQDYEIDENLLARFFASLGGMPFDDRHHRELLQLCLEDGTGDPLRWSAARLGGLLNAAIVDDDLIPVQAQLGVPDLLRAFVPFAHAESGIRQELTAEALAAIDDAACEYRAIVIEAAERRDFLDGDEG